MVIVLCITRVGNSHNYDHMGQWIVHKIPQKNRLEKLDSGEPTQNSMKPTRTFPPKALPETLCSQIAISILEDLSRFSQI